MGHPHKKIVSKSNMFIKTLIPTLLLFPVPITNPRGLSSLNPNKSEPEILKLQRRTFGQMPHLHFRTAQAILLANQYPDKPQP